MLQHKMAHTMQHAGSVPREYKATYSIHKPPPTNYSTETQQHSSSRKIETKTKTHKKKKRERMTVVYSVSDSYARAVTQQTETEQQPTRRTEIETVKEENVRGFMCSKDVGIGASI